MGDRASNTDPVLLNSTLFYIVRRVRTKFVGSVRKTKWVTLLQCCALSARPESTGVARTPVEPDGRKSSPQSFFPFLAKEHSMWDLPPPGIKPTPPAVEAQSLNHWTTREVPAPSLTGPTGLGTPPHTRCLHSLNLQLARAYQDQLCARQVCGADGAE